MGPTDWFYLWFCEYYTGDPDVNSSYKKPFSVRVNSAWYVRVLRKRPKDLPVDSDFCMFVCMFWLHARSFDPWLFTEFFAMWLARLGVWREALLGPNMKSLTSQHPLAEAFLAESMYRFIPLRELSVRVYQTRTLIWWVNMLVCHYSTLTNTRLPSCRYFFFCCCCIVCWLFVAFLRSVWFDMVLTAFARIRYLCPTCSLIRKITAWKEA